MPAVHYRLKSVTDYQTIIFNGDNISLAEFKNRIIDKNSVQNRTTGFDLDIKDELSGKVFDEKNFLIPKNSKLLIARIPLKDNNYKSWASNRNLKKIKTILPAQKTACPDPISVKPLNTGNLEVKVLQKTMAHSFPLSTGGKIPGDLLCTVCHDFNLGAIILACCSESICHTCARSMVGESDGKCSLCKKSFSWAACVPNMFLRRSVEAYKTTFESKNGVNSDNTADHISTKCISLDSGVKNGSGDCKDHISSDNVGSLPNTCQFLNQHCPVLSNVRSYGGIIPEKLPIMGYFPMFGPIGRPFGPCLLSGDDLIKLKSEFIDDRDVRHNGVTSSRKRVMRDTLDMHSASKRIAR